MSALNFSISAQSLSRCANSAQPPLRPRSAKDGRILAACALALAGSLTSATRALAQQCDAYWNGIPDFDQRRELSTNPLRLGLPGNGSMWCVPTSALNLLAFMDIRGQPAAIQGGPPNVSWANDDADVYNRVSTLLFELGDKMGTTGSGGTSGSGGFDGLEDWLEDRGLADQFIVDEVSGSGDGYPSPGGAYNTIVGGGLVQMVFGNYVKDGDQWERDGGHAISLAYVFDKCGATPKYGIRNPSSGDSTFHQAAFGTAVHELAKQTKNIDGDVLPVWVITTNQQPNKLRLYDRRRWIQVGNLLTVDPGIGKPVLMTPIKAWQFAPRMSTLDSDAYGIAIGALYNHFDSSYFVLTEGRRGVPPTLLHFTPGVPTPTVVDTYASRPELLSLNRFGHVFVVVGNQLKRYKVVDDVARPVGQLVLPYAPDAAEADDASGELVLLTKASRESGVGRQILRVRSDLTLKSAQPLPGDLSLPGDGVCVVHPKTHELIVGASGAAALSQIGTDPASGRLYVGRTLAHPELRRVSALQATDRGQLVVLSEGIVRVFEETAAAGLMPVSDSPWVRTPAIGGSQFLTVTRSRHNLDDRHARWLDVDEDFVGAPSTADCGPDFNVDGAVDGTDYEDFIQCHAGKHSCPRGRDADYDANGVVDGSDLSQFLRDYGAPPPACVTP